MKSYMSKEDIQLEKKHVKGYSTSLAIREVQIKTTMRYDYTSIKIARNKTKQINNKIVKCQMLVRMKKTRALIHFTLVKCKMFTVSLKNG